MSVFDNRKKNVAMNIEVNTEWKYVASIRDFTLKFFLIHLNNKTLADKAALAISELLENAIKYSVEDPVKINIEGNDDAIKIIVRNISDTNNSTILKTEFKKIMQNSPLEASLSKLKEAAERNDNKSMLGLSRIRYETGGKFKIEIHKNKVTASLIIKNKKEGAANEQA